MKSKQRKPVSVEAARLRMADLCARSEQCAYEIRQKLSRMGLPPHDVEDVLDFLRREKFVDDARYARSYARDKCRFSGWGVNKIRLGLMAKRIDAHLVDVAVKSIDAGDYREALKRAAASKAAGLDLHGSEGQANRAKLYRHIISRGFEPELAGKVVGYLASRQIGDNRHG